MKQTKKTGRLLSAVLAAAMSISALPLMSITAEAAANTDWNFTDYEDKYHSRKGTGFEWIVNSTGSHTLNISNVNISGKLQVPDDTTIKFSGKNTITSNEGGIDGYGALSVLGADSNSTLTIKCKSTYDAGIRSSDELKLSGTINVTSEYHCIRGNSITVKNAKITSKTSKQYALTASKEITVQSSEIESKFGSISCDDLKIKSSIVSINDTANSYNGIYAKNLTVSGSKLDINASGSAAISVNGVTKFSNSDIKARTNSSCAVNVKTFEMSSGTLDAATTKENYSAIRYNTNTNFALNSKLSIKGSSSASGAADTKLTYKDGDFILGKEGYRTIYAQRVVITDGKKIIVDTSESSASKRTLSVDFGKKFAGEKVVLYKIEAGNQVKVKSATLDSKGKAEFNILNGVSYVVKFA